MYSPHLQHQLVQAHIQDLHSFRQTWIARPITTNERIAARNRKAAKLSGHAASRRATKHSGNSQLASASCTGPRLACLAQIAPTHRARRRPSGAQ
jgi:hypothetical protein